MILQKLDDFFTVNKLYESETKSRIRINMKRIRKL